MYSVKLAKLRCRNCGKFFGEAYCMKFIDYPDESYFNSGFSQIPYNGGIMQVFCCDQCKLEWMFSMYEDEAEADTNEDTNPCV